MIKIYGGSDDGVVVEGCKGADEYGTAEPGPLMWRGDLIGPDGGQMRVYGIYDGCWHFSMGQVDEAVFMPPWTTSVTQAEDVDYSAVLLIDAPDGTRLTNIWPTRDNG